MRIIRILSFIMFIFIYYRYIYVVSVVEKYTFPSLLSIALYLFISIMILISKDRKITYTYLLIITIISVRSIYRYGCDLLIINPRATGVDLLEIFSLFLLAGVSMVALRLYLRR